MKDGFFERFVIRAGTGVFVVVLFVLCVILGNALIFVTRYALLREPSYAYLVPAEYRVLREEYHDNVLELELKIPKEKSAEQAVNELRSAVKDFGKPVRVTLCVEPNDSAYGDMI